MRQAYITNKVKEFKEVGIIQCGHALFTQLEEFKGDKLHLVVSCPTCNQRIGSLETIIRETRAI